MYKSGLEFVSGYPNIVTQIISTKTMKVYPHTEQIKQFLMCSTLTEGPVTFILKINLIH